jgi:hypothetical protein
VLLLTLQEPTGRVKKARSENQIDKRLQQLSYPTVLLLDLAAMIEAGHRLRRLPITAHCQKCGDVGQLQVRRPMPQRDSAGWASPGTP